LINTQLIINKKHMADNNGWIRVGGEGSDNKTWDFKTNKEITGIYTGARDVNTKDGSVSRLYMVDTTEGPTTVWEKTALKSLMSEVPLGSEVKITYLGEVQSKKNPTKTYHNFAVDHRPAGTVDGEVAVESSETELPFLG
jgi:spore coat protein U-like protein